MQREYCVLSFYAHAWACFTCCASFLKNDFWWVFSNFHCELICICINLDLHDYGGRLIAWYLYPSKHVFLLLSKLGQLWTLSVCMNLNLQDYILKLMVSNSVCASIATIMSNSHTVHCELCINFNLQDYNFKTVFDPFAKYPLSFGTAWTTYHVPTHSW